MKTTEKALATLAKIREMVEDADYGFDNPEAKQRFAGLVRVLKMQASGFFLNDTRQIYLNGQIYKLDEFKEDLFGGGKPRFWQTHDECKADMEMRCNLAQDLIQRHAREHKEAVVSGAQLS